MSYETDFVEWTRAQAANLRRLAELRVNLPVGLDLEHLAEEVEDMGNNIVAVVRGLLRQVLIHLLKLEWSRERFPRTHWMDEIDTFRDDARCRLEDSPNALRRIPLDDLYRFAKRHCRRHFDDAIFRQLPTECPYTIDQLFDPDFFPKNRHGIETEREGGG